MERREWIEGPSHKEEEREAGSGKWKGPGALSWEWKAPYLYFARAHRVPRYATADGAGLPT